jgi:hypothetical protein
MHREMERLSKQVAWGEVKLAITRPQEIVFPRETCHIFASFFMSPRFSFPLLGDFSAHGFCR